MKFRLMMMGMGVSLIMIQSALAQHHHAGDIYLDLSQDGTEVLVGSGPGDFDEKVFAADLEQLLAGEPWETNEPGYDSSHPGPFNTGHSMGFSILDALRQWDGNDFDTIASEQMEVGFLSLGETTPTTADTTVQGFRLDIDPDGGWHKHLDYELPDGTASGVYLLKLQLELFDGPRESTSATQIATSDPFYLVFGLGADENTHDAAIEYVEHEIVPEPTTIALLGIGGLMALRRRHR